MILSGQPTTSRPFHFMAKPRGAICNLDCAYCYFLETEKLYPGSSFRVSVDVLENFTKQYIESQPTNHVTFSWHDGNPTLAGLDFYRTALHFQDK